MQSHMHKKTHMHTHTHIHTCLLKMHRKRCRRAGRRAEYLSDGCTLKGRGKRQAGRETRHPPYTQAPHKHPTPNLPCLAFLSASSLFLTAAACPDAAAPRLSRSTPSSMRTHTHFVTRHTMCVRGCREREREKERKKYTPSLERGLSSSNFSRAARACNCNGDNFIFFDRLPVSPSLGEIGTACF